MCSVAVYEFFVESIKAEEFNKRVLETGSKYVFRVCPFESNIIANRKTKIFTVANQSEIWFGMKQAYRHFGVSIG